MIFRLGQNDPVRQPDIVFRINRKLLVHHSGPSWHDADAIGFVGIVQVLDVIVPIPDHHVNIGHDYLRTYIRRLFLN